MSNSLKNRLSASYESLPAPLKIRLEAFMNMESTRVYKDLRFRFLIVSAVMAVIVVLAMPEKPAAETKVQTTEIDLKPAIDLTRDDLFLAENEQHPIKTQTLMLASGDALGSLLQKNGVEANTAYQLTEAFSTAYDPRRLRAGQKFILHYRDGVLTDMTYKPAIEQTIFVGRTGDNDFAAKTIDAEFSFETVSLSTQIENSLYLDAKKFGVPDKVIVQFANIYEYSVDFQRDIQPGDAFEMVFEIARDKKGEIVKAGDLIFTSFSPRSKTQEYYLYADSKGQENFYDASGKTAKRKLRATPINGARLSSSFGKRRHPILGYRKMHTGVDFAAPRGTPILAAGTGTVEVAGRNGGYGNYIRLRHSDGYKTAYAHMQSFARGVRKGTRVRQDQVIGYVGSTGRSTGPHLHYEVHHNGKKINPRHLSQLSGKPLDKAQIPAFKKRRAEIDDLRGKAAALTRERPAAQLSAERASDNQTESAVRPQ